MDQIELLLEVLNAGLLDLLDGMRSIPVGHEPGVLVHLHTGAHALRHPPLPDAPGLLSLPELVVVLLSDPAVHLDISDGHAVGRRIVLRGR